MTPEMVCAAADRLWQFHAEFEECFGRREAREHSRVYVRGLLAHRERKNVESIALHFSPGRDGKPAGDNEVQALQHFLSNSPWDHRDVQRRIQKVFARELAPSAVESPVGVVGVIDESGDEKSGKHSCGTATQWFGRLGKTEVCQVGVFLTAIAPRGAALLEHELFLPESWVADVAARKKTRVPEEIRFRTKPEIAIELLQRLRANGEVQCDWIAADSLYGKSGAFLDALDAMGQKYVVEVACDTTFWTEDPATQIPEYCGHGKRPTRPTREAVRQAQQIATALPADAWQPEKLRDGAKGPLVAEFACLRVWSVRHGKPGPTVWLVFRRELGSTDVKYYVSNAEETNPLQTLVLVIGARWRVEEFFEDAKEYLGLADYEARGWPSWHHHMSMVALAHLYVNLVRDDLRSDLPELTFDRAFHLVCDTFSRPKLTPAESLYLTEYHLNHTRAANESHSRAWQRRHPELK